MPIVPGAYDRSPLTLHEKEVMAIAARLRGSARGVSRLQYAKKELMRFQEPIFAIMALRTRDKAMYQKIRRLLYREMVRRGTSFWEWSKEEWLETICPTNQEFVRTYGRVGGRQSLMDIAYLLCGMTDLREADQKRECVETARYIFGTKLIERELRRITGVLMGKKGRGYSQGRFSVQNLRQALCWLFLLNRNPYVENLSEEILSTAEQGPNALKSHFIAKIRVALQELGIVASPQKAVSASACTIETTGIAQEWVEWAQVWFKRHPKVTARVHDAYAIVLIVGRWLAATHPAITSPEQWDEDLALEYINYVCTSARVGDYVSARGMKYLNKERVGKPLAPRTMEARIAALRRFFTDLQDRPHAVGKAPSHNIERRFTPGMLFDLPPSIKRLIQPDPRDIDEVVWCKLTYAAATLAEEDASPLWWRYPVSYYQAVALLWVTSARRPNEIMRLRIGCIRRDWDPEMLDEQGVPFPEQDARLCYLQIPSSKTKGPYWVPIPGYAADAVEAWERERPTNQPKLIDPKDNSQVDFLFCLRGKRMGWKFINGSLIPLLCKRAGIPEHDARGTITGHRARSTIATMLRKNGLSLDDISQFLGHANPNTVKAYARTDQFRFGRDVNRANDLMRIVEGVIDTRAAKAGKPNVFFFLGRGADGQPRFCGNPAWEKCAHRLACLKCPMYVGASQASRLTERLEARDEIFKFQTRVEMTPQEKAATAGDIETLTELITAESDTPPPELPSEDFRFNAQDSKKDDFSPPHESQSDLLALGQKLAELNRALASAEQHADGRNASVRSLKKQIAQVTEQMETLEQIITGLTNTTLGT